MWSVASPWLTEPAMMNGYLRCACSASFQDLQLLLPEQQGRKPSLLRTAHLLTVTDDSHSCPTQEARGHYGGFVGPLGRERKGTPTILLPIDGAPHVHSHTDPRLSPSVAGCLPFLAYTGCFLAFLPSPQSH